MLEINQHRSTITASFDDGNSLSVAMNQIVCLANTLYYEVNRFKDATCRRSRM